MTSEPKRRSGRATLWEVVQLANITASVGSPDIAIELQWQNVSIALLSSNFLPSKRSHDLASGSFSFHHQSPRSVALAKETLTRRPDSVIRANQNVFLLRGTSIGAASVHSTCAMEQPS